MTTEQKQNILFKCGKLYVNCITCDIVSSVSTVTAHISVTLLAPCGKLTTGGTTKKIFEKFGKLSSLFRLYLGNLKYE